MCTYVAFQLAVRILETDTNNVYIMLKHQLYLSATNSRGLQSY